jgi:hypothetical protein
LDGDRNLVQVAGALNPDGALLGRRQRGQRDRGQDGNNHQQFNQGETASKVADLVCTGCIFPWLTFCIVGNVLSSLRLLQPSCLDSEP